MSHVGVDNVYSLDLSSNGRVLLNTVVAGLVVAPDIATKTKLWSKQLGGLVHTLRIVGNVVVGPAYDCPVSVLDVVTGDTIRQWPALKGNTHSIAVFSGMSIGYILQSWLVTWRLTCLLQRLNTRLPFNKQTTPKMCMVYAWYMHAFKLVFGHILFTIHSEGYFSNENASQTTISTRSRSLYGTVHSVVAKTKMHAFVASRIHERQIEKDDR